MSGLGAASPVKDPDDENDTGEKTGAPRIPAA
jgi:hypothetical protein